MTTPLPMMQVTPGCRMPDGIRCRTNFLPVHVHRVSGVVAALIARDGREVRRQHVDDLALALVAPLRAQHCDVGFDIRLYRTSRTQRASTNVSRHRTRAQSQGDDRLTYDAYVVSRIVTVTCPRRRITDVIDLTATRSRSTISSRSRTTTSSSRLSDAARERVRAARVVVDEFARPRRRRPTASTPASATSPTCGSRTTRSPSCRSICCAATPPASASRCRCRSCARRWRCAPTCWRRASPGIRLETLDLLIELLNRRRPPVVPSRGSVGRERRSRAAGAPCARADRRRRSAGTTATREPGAAALARAGLTPASLAPKEGLALINGTQPSTALLGLALAGAERLARAADIAAALSIDGLQGSTKPFDARIHDGPGSGRPANLRGKPSRICSPAAASTPPTPTAAACRTPIRCAAPPRCTARRATPSHSRIGTFDAEANAATDNPMVFADTARDRLRRQLSRRAGRVAADVLCLGLAQLATISERRSDRLVNPSSSGLPAFLTRHGGLQSGLMMAQVTAAALTSELKTLAHPASVDTIPTSGNKEDHVSMSMAAGAEGDARARARATGDRDRIALRVSGDRSARAAHLVAAARARA